MEITHLNKKNTNEIIILLHGGPGFSHDYFVGGFDNCAYQCVSFDLGSLGMHHMSAYTSELAQVIKHFSDKDIYLLGHSFGSAVALEYFYVDPKIIKKLILSNFIYDSSFLNINLNDSWLEGFNKGPKLAETHGQGDEFFKAFALELAPLYFSSDKKELALKTFNNIKYSFSAYNEITNNYLNDFSFKKLILENKEKMAFILSKNETRLPLEYFSPLLVKGIETNIIDTESHFYFLEEPEKYQIVLESLIN